LSRKKSHYRLYIRYAEVQHAFEIKLLALIMVGEDVSMQLSCYAMYAMDKWGIDLENVKLIEYNLLANQGAELNVSGAEIENTKAYKLWHRVLQYVINLTMGSIPMHFRQAFTKTDSANPLFIAFY
jgi:hypothetical protein